MRPVEFDCLKGLRITEINSIGMEKAAPFLLSKGTLEVNFVVCQLFALLAAVWFRTYLHSSKTSSFIRHVVATLLGLYLAFFCFGWYALHFLVQSGISYCIMIIAGVESMQQCCFVFALGYLSVCQITRVYIFDYGQYSADFSGPMMIITQKITSLAYEIHDGMFRKDEELTPSQRGLAVSKVILSFSGRRIILSRVPLEPPRSHHTLCSDVCFLPFVVAPSLQPCWHGDQPQWHHWSRRMPSLLEYVSYTCNFMGILAGPLCSYKDYIAFIEGRASHVAQPSENGKDEQHGKADPSPNAAVTEKLLVCGLSLLFHLTISNMLPVEYNIDEHFQATASWPTKATYLYVSLLAARPKYYFAWTLADAINNAAGFGFRGYDKNGVARWDLISNLRIQQIEMSTSFKMFLDNWNIQTALWLKRVCYERATFSPTIQTFFLSAIWHGVYPGYYLTFLTGVLMTLAARAVRNNFRHYFLEPPQLTGSTLLQPLSNAVQLPIDQVNFVVCQLFALLAAVWFRTYLHSSKTSSFIRHVVATLLGLYLAFFCFGWYALHFLVQSGISYCIMIIAGVESMQQCCFVFALGYLSVCQITRVYIFDYGQYSADFSGPMMIITQKITSLAYEIHDGMFRKDEELTPSQRGLAVRRMPSLLEYVSYTCNFMGILAGPLCSYKDYIAFIEGRASHVAQPSENGKDEQHGKADPSPNAAVTEKLLVCGLSLLFHLTISNMLPVEYNIDEHFQATASWPTKATYLYVSLLAARPKYYFAWTLADAINNAAGFGFRGYDKNGVARWDLISNLRIQQIEMSTSFKMFLDNWNIQTALWLKRVCYERATFSPTIQTFFLSAIWHGVYPGYYLTFLTGVLMTLAARAVRNNFRHYFLEPPQLTGSTLLQPLSNAVQLPIDQNVCSWNPAAIL